MRDYGVKSSDRIVSVEPLEDIVVVFKNKKGRYLADSIAIFWKKREANSFWEKNGDWEVVPCEISFPPQK